MPNIKGPDGRVVSFPEGTSDADIAAAFQNQPAAGDGGVLDTAKNFGLGLAEGGYNTVGGLLHMVGAKKAGDAFTNAAVPQNTAQSFGRGAEQAGEFLIPGLGEEAAAARLGLLGKSGAKVAAQALGTGAVNKAQGGSFFGGAALGAGGSALAEGAKAIAPVVAEKALGITKTMRGYGKTPGQAIIDETTGVRPATIAGTATNKVNELTAANNALESSYKNPVSIQPGVDSVSDDIAKAMRRNNVTGVNALQPVRSQLTENVFGASQPFGITAQGSLSPFQTAESAADLKRGLRDQFVKNWNPDAASILTRDSAKKASHAIDQQLDFALGPEYASRNQRISSLLPVKERAESTNLNDSVIARSLGRVAAHTGAGAAGISGAYLGERSDGAKGAVIGGLAGLMAPEMLTNPTTLMIGARGLASPVLSKFAIPGISGAAIQMTRGGK